MKIDLAEAITGISMTVALWVVIVSYLEKRQLHQTINRLTDKLIGVHREPKAKSEPIKEDDSSPVKDDEPKGWYDH